MSGELTPQQIQQLQLMQQQRQLSQSQYQGNVDAGEFIEKLLSNEHVPKSVAERFWALFSRNAKLTFLSEEDIEIQMIHFELLRITFIESIPKNAYNEEIEFLLISLRIEFLNILKRAAGNGRLNERELEGASTYASFSDRPITPTSSENAGILSRFSSAVRRATGGK